LEVAVNVSDQPINDELMGNLRGCATDAAAVLHTDLASAAPTDVVEAIDAFAYRWQKGDRPPPEVVEDTEQARLIFGSLWGEQLVRQIGWEWAFVDVGDGSRALGVVSQDRSFVVYPLDFMLDCMQDANVDVTVALSFNMLMAGSVPKLPPRSYANLMDGVRRIVPRD
jgi:hypothetical protein